MQTGKAILGAMALALLVGCGGGTTERAEAPPVVEDRPVPDSEAADRRGGPQPSRGRARVVRQ